MSPKSLLELERGVRRSVVARSVVRMCASGVALLVLYAVYPDETSSGAGLVLELAFGLALVGLVLGFQIRSIVRADYPELRAVESVVLTVTVFLVVFSLVYLQLSSTDAANFSEPLDKVSAFYFTVSVLSTVGFGDISASSDTARVVTTAQMLLDVTLVVVVVRLIFGTARASLSGRHEP